MNVKLVLAGAMVIVCGVAGLAALGGSTVNSVDFDKVAKTRERIEVYGAVDKSTIRSQKGAHLVTFDILEEESVGDKKRLTGQRIAVVYDNPASALPANFPAASHARVAGTYDPTLKRFAADRVLTKCPSKYEEKDLDFDTRAAMARWKKETGLSAEGAVAPSGGS